MAHLHDRAHLFYENHGACLQKKYPGLSPRKILSDLENLLKSQGKSSVEDYFSHLETGIPIEYFTKRASFFGHDFYVDERAFIPRFETEVLVEMALELLHPNHIVVDVGTGLGNIACTLALEYPGSLAIRALDICPLARAVAHINITRKAPYRDRATTIALGGGDRLERFSGKAHLIVSNPPYIKRVQDTALVHPQVMAHEPSRALFLNDDEYDSWYSLFFKQVDQKLFAPGAFLLEGHEHHLEGLMLVLARFPFKEIEIVRDLTGRKRFLKALR